MNKSSRFSVRGIFSFILLTVFVCLIKLNSELSSPVYSTTPLPLPSYIELVVSCASDFIPDQYFFHVNTVCESVVYAATADCSAQFRFALFSYENFVSTVLKNESVSHSFVAFLHKLFIPTNSSDDSPLTLA